MRVIKFKISDALSLACSLILIVCFVIVALDYTYDWFNFSIADLTIMCFLVTFISYMKVFSTEGYQRLGFHMVIMTYTILVHFGFLFAYYMDSKAAIIRSAYSMRFMYSEAFPTAIQISLLVIIAFVLCGSTRLYRGKQIVQLPETRPHNGIMWTVYILGTTILSIGFILLVSLIFNGYLNLSYSQRVQAFAAISWYGHLIILISFAFCMMIAVLPKNKWRIGLYLFVLIAIAHFMLGNRGEVLYSAGSCVAVYYLRYGDIGKKWIVLGALALIFGIPLIRDFRAAFQIDLYTLSLKKNIIELFSELGFQIGPFTYAVEIINSGLGHQHGGTYLYNFADFLARKMPFLPQLPTESVVNIKYMMPGKGLGFSHVAEAYYNFGVMGACIYYTLLSRLILKLELVFKSASASPYKRIFASLLVVEIINLTRNSFHTFPVYFSYIIVLITLIYILGNIVPKIRSSFKNPTLNNAKLNLNGSVNNGTIGHCNNSDI